MLSVYRVDADLEKYQYLMAEDIGALTKYRFDGSSIESEWTPPSSYCANPKKARPDFWGCFANAAIFAVPLEVAPKVITFLDQSCETLPFEADCGKFLLCNVTCVVNALDKKRSHHKKGLPHWINKYAFHANRFEYSLFKIPETAMSEVLCVEGLADPFDEFKGRVEKEGLKGLRFKKLWSGD
jgi:hypothetical protein